MRLSLCSPRVSLLALGLVTLAPTPVRAQDAWDPSRVYASRSSLDSLARRFELSAESPAYSQALRTQAEEEARTLRERLTQGDFQVGDQIVLFVEDEATLSDSFTVEVGPAIRLPAVGTVPLAGVLRAELEDHLTRELERYIRGPRLQARTLIRISVAGEVGTPGFYAVPSEVMVTDVLAQAGQVTRAAKIEDIRIERAGRVIWDNRALAQEILQGRTLDQLGVRAGDLLVVAGRKGLGNFEGSTRTLLLLITLPATIAGVVAIFK